MRGAGSGAILEALPIPLGSTNELFNPPTFAGPGAMPLIGKLPDPTAPAIRAACANETVGAARDSSNTKEIFAGVLDMTELHCLTSAFAQLELIWACPANGTTKLSFRMLAKQGCVVISRHPVSLAVFSLVARRRVTQAIDT